MSSGGRTYRTLRGVMGPVDMRESIPEWAQGYAVGDEIGVRHPKTGEVAIGMVLGFSSVAEYQGRPVIRKPFGGAGLLALREIDYVLPEVARAELRRSADTPG